MPLYVSVNNNFYGVWCAIDSSMHADAVPAALRTAAVISNIRKLQREFITLGNKK